MRPPRPWPSWRRAMSRSIASRSSSSPAGRPSTMVVSPGPWDSPAVTMRSGTAGILDARRARACAGGATSRAGAPPRPARPAGRRARRWPSTRAGRAWRPCRAAVVGPAQRPAAAEVPAQRAGARLARRAGRPGLARRGRGLVNDAEQVELVGLGHGAARGVLDVEELGVALVQGHGLAVGRVGLAGAVALRLSRSSRPGTPRRLPAPRPR